MTSLNEAIEAEQPDDGGKVWGYIELGRVLTPFERSRLNFDPTFPIYRDPVTEARAIAAEDSWWNNMKTRRRDIPVTCKVRGE